MRNFPYFTASLGVAFLVFLYVNYDDQVYEYWRQVEQGNVPVDYGEDDDDDDEDDEEDEWEEKKGR